MDHLLKQGINSKHAGKTSWNYQKSWVYIPISPIVSIRKKNTVLPPVSAPNKAGPAAPCWSEHRMTWWFKLTHLRSFHVEPPDFSTLEIGNPSSFFQATQCVGNWDNWLIHSSSLGFLRRWGAMLACLLASLLPCFLACLLACFLACLLVVTPKKKAS